jgi:1,4-dihydroxy-6-naphthoate synthase
VKIADLGEFWEARTGKAIPLGGIVAARTLPHELLLKINHLISESVRYAFGNPASSHDFVKKNAQQTEEKVIAEHIKSYVNHFTLSLGKAGRVAVEYLFEEALNAGMIPKIPENIFLDRP